MAKRGGKAASRRSRQRRAQRPAAPPIPSQSAAPEAPETPEATTSADATSAFDAADAELRASVPAPGTRTTPSRGPAATPRSFEGYGSTGPSRLTDKAALEYHYVARDLRNIAVLVVVLAVLLALSAVAVTLLDIGQA